MIIVLVSKVILAIALLLLSTPVSDFGCWVMSPVASKPRLELVLVMVVGPYILNAAQFWVRHRTTPRPLAHAHTRAPCSPPTRRGAVAGRSWTTS